MMHATYLPTYHSVNTADALFTSIEVNNVQYLQKETHTDAHFNCLYILWFYAVLDVLFSC